METELIGGLAATLTTASFLPQAARVIRTNDTAAISLWMYLLFTFGVALWGAYGLLIGSRPVVVANAVTLTLALVILVQKIRHVRAARTKSRPR
ncbi:SemiSWEET family sugar transporter [Amphiplicatus metriothermophilus]|uniref:MtN3 and saliva related transmembrane protein n=1 Tax=Amphiplicatus metriothermophilus TaxID=1519374 RepID=A0A239PJJ6_9PROT|nr:SemiSWEET transporter [Amphiplicatus metriothermophilus]MBB5517937.1 MtN3 and saliva related transmembrane protein [Amphiplicatus metriothermophilus]SNT67730.1 MtN3 and saliva related transmembrane protein [Amphiplicatus metriothermophilus]